MFIEEIEKMLDKKMKEMLLKLKNIEDIGKYLKENKISLLIDDKDVQQHLSKYYNFPDDGIIRDIK